MAQICLIPDRDKFRTMRLITDFLQKLIRRSISTYMHAEQHTLFSVRFFSAMTH